MLMKRAVAAECGRISQEWRHRRSCSRAAKGIKQQEFLSCGPLRTGWGAGGLSSGGLNSEVEAEVGTQSLERVSDLSKVTQLVADPSSWAGVGVATSGFHLTLRDKSNV